MRGVEYAELEAFLTVARHASFRRAATELVVSPSAVSHTIRALEERLGVRLFHRTTRSVALTEAGVALRTRIAPAFETINRSVSEASDSAGSAGGLVRITAPHVACRMVLSPALPGFLRSHPDIRIEVDVNDGLIDSVEEGFDAGVRLGESLRSDMDSVAISAPLQGRLVASPDYLALRGVPLEPEDLKRHDGLNFRLPSGQILPWEFTRDGKDTAFVQPGPLATNDADLLVDAALGGLGVLCITAPLVEAHIQSGRLVALLSDWSDPYPGWFLYYPRGRLVPPALRRLRDWLSDPTVLARDDPG